ncbi:MAG: 30S ribosomal protein S20, partial [Candidatus Nealsonbacteria bacterium CG_4_9_14_0_8_um_filter_36_17]
MIKKKYMAITRSAKKALRQSERRKIRNIQRKRKIKDLLKEVKSLVSQKKIEGAKELLPQVYKLLDKAAKTDLIKKNTAARKKSRMARLISKIELGSKS